MIILKGIVLKSTGSWYRVELNDGNILKCRLRGKFKTKDLKTTNPIAVGDIVYVSVQEDEIGNIVEIGERRNCIIRKSTNLSKQTHLIAANIDQSVLIVTLAFPRTSTGFIDRFLISAEAYNVPSIIVFNKTDLYDELSMEKLYDLMSVYNSAGYQTLEVSAKTSFNMEKFKLLLKDKTSMLSGHSGVGKSHIINYLQPNLKIKTQDISDYHQKGKHTTTFSEMHELDFGGKIIDTPGIKEFGLVDFEAWELGHWFPEFKKFIPNCKFSNCTHYHEPNCAVREAVEKNIIDNVRYENYLKILNNVEEELEDWE